MLHKQAEQYKTMVYNAHMLMKDYYTYDELMEMPLKYLFEELDFFSARAKEIAERQTKEQLEHDLTGRSKGKRKPRG